MGIIKKSAAFATLIIGLTLFLKLDVSTLTELVATRDGLVQGRVAYSRDGLAYKAFLSIPYAEPPVGPLRFEPPVPLRKPFSYLKAVNYSPTCTQFDGFTATVKGTEDCLYLNVFTHSIRPQKALPVIVFIHGGGFSQGSTSSHVPSYFMDSKDIVLVTINYRLGPLGFINTGDNLIRGNMGLKDQNLALKWVQKNIKFFGGSPDKVTIFGTSAGSASVHYHMISEKSSGLFSRAIMQSAAATCPWAHERKPKDVLLNYVKTLNCPQDDMEALVKCLKTIDAKELLKPQISAMIPTNDYLIFVPSKEAVITPDTFLTEDPVELLRAGKFKKVPLMLGVTSGEGYLRLARFEVMPELIPEVDLKWEEVGHTVLCHKSLEGNKKALGEVRDLYLGDKPFIEDMKNFKYKFGMAGSDANFFEPVHTAAKLYLEGGGEELYLYHFGYESKIMPSVYSVAGAVRHDEFKALMGIKTVWRILVDFVKKNWFRETDGPHRFGVVHGSDIFMMWDYEGVSSYFMGEDDKNLSKALVASIISFAKGEEKLKFNGLDWPRTTIDDKPLRYMHIDKEAKVIYEPFAERMPFWENIREICRDK